MRSRTRRRLSPRAVAISVAAVAVLAATATVAAGATPPLLTHAGPMAVTARSPVRWGPSGWGPRSGWGDPAPATVVGHRPPARTEYFHVVSTTSSGPGSASGDMAGLTGSGHCTFGAPSTTARVAGHCSRAATAYTETIDGVATVKGTDG